MLVSKAHNNYSPAQRFKDHAGTRVKPEKTEID